MYKLEDYFLVFSLWFDKEKEGFGNVENGWNWRWFGRDLEGMGLGEKMMY